MTIWTLKAVEGQLFIYKLHLWVRSFKTFCNICRSAWLCQLLSLAKLPMFVTNRNLISAFLRSCHKLEPILSNLRSVWGRFLNIIPCNHSWFWCLLLFKLKWKKLRFSCERINQFTYIDLFITDNNFNFDRKRHQTFDETLRRVQIHWTCSHLFMVSNHAWFKEMYV